MIRRSRAQVAAGASPDAHLRGLGGLGFILTMVGVGASRRYRLGLHQAKNCRRGG
jgi:hypothetical protein